MNTRTTAKDFFLHLGATVSLYAATIALLNLAFTIINKLLPDPLSSYWSSGSIVWPVSALIVLTPILCTLEWLISRDIVRMPEKKDIWVRTWRIYLTLFLTGATIIVDLITLLSTFLNGEITSRFAFKVLVVFVVSAVIFAYYLLSKASSSLASMKWQRVLTWAGIALVLISVVAGFAIVGSPANQRAQRFDEQRVNDLTSIQWSILNYWQTTGTIAPSLDTLADPLSTSIVRADPKTGAPYEYRATGGSSFQLCATFETSSIDSGSVSPYTPRSVSDIGGNWNHAVGKQCFDRTIDPVRYPVNQSPAKFPVR